MVTYCTVLYLVFFFILHYFLMNISIENYFSFFLIASYYSFACVIIYLTCELVLFFIFGCLGSSLLRAVFL